MRSDSHTLSVFIPDFIDIQRKSFYQFLEIGFIQEFLRRNIITNFTKDLELIFYPQYYQLNPPEWNPKQAILKSKTYACRLYVPVQLTNYQTREVKLKWVLLGNLPLMTKRGHFIVNGSPRVIINQMIRSPGIYYQENIDKKKKRTYYADLISYRGTWLRLETDKKKRIWARMKKTPKVSILVFLQAMGLTKEIIFESIHYSEYLKYSFLKENHPGSTKEALIRLYSITHPKKDKNDIFSDLGQKFLFRKFLNSKTYDLGKLGRLRLNKKLGLSIPLNQQILTPQDILYATDYLIKLEYGIGKIDDIDHLQNRRVRTSGELIQNQFATGFIRLEKMIREKMKKAKKKLSIRSLLTTKPINGALREFFGSSQLSQFMDQTNPLAEITHKRRLSSLGPGGISRETAGMAVRGIHPTHYGRICPIETPEGPNAGLVNSITTYARINSDGFLETPFFQVYRSQVQKQKGPIFISAEQEEKFLIAPGDLKLSLLNFLPKNLIPIRSGHDFKRVFRDQVQYIGISPIQMISIATSLIPFLEHDDANRALMGSNMQRQAVPLIRPEQPVVGTGLEIRVVSDAGHILQTATSGYIYYISGQKIILIKKNKLSNLFYRKNHFFKNNKIGFLFSTFSFLFVALFFINLKNLSFLNKFTKRRKTNKLLFFNQYNKLEKKEMKNFSKKYITFFLKNTSKRKYFVNSLLKELNSCQKIQNSREEFFFEKRFIKNKSIKKNNCIVRLFTTHEYFKSIFTFTLNFSPFYNQDHEIKRSSIKFLSNWSIQKNSSAKYKEKFFQKKVFYKKNFQNRYLNLGIFSCLLNSKLTKSVETYNNQEFQEQKMFRNFEYTLQNFHRSNQDTCLIQRPIINENDWIQKGDLLADGAASNQGQLSLGKNILIAYIPWEGYNFEDAILISERLVYDDIYTSIHIERYEVEIRDTKFGVEQITHQIPERDLLEISHLDENGIAKLGTWVKEGDILVGKITPIRKKNLTPHEKLLYDIVGKEIPTTRDTSLRVPKGVQGRVINVQILDTENIPPEIAFEGPGRVHIYLAEKRKIQVGDKMAGRHGNKGIVSKILPRQDMPYLPDGTPLDMVLNPLGVPSRMNVGQVFECLLGLAGFFLKQQYKIIPFDEIYGSESSRSLVYSKLYEASLKTGQKWLFSPEFPGKTVLFDGRTGNYFDQPVTVGQAYILKLVHLVDEKIHARSTGPYSLVTQQPLRGRSKHGGQRLGEMEVWALEGFGAAYTLQELLTVKSDDMKGRHQVMDALLNNEPIALGTPESFKVLIRELQSLCLDVGVYTIDSFGKRKQIDVMKLP